MVIALLQFKISPTSLHLRHASAFHAHRHPSHCAIAVCVHVDLDHTRRRRRRLHHCASVVQGGRGRRNQRCEDVNEEHEGTDLKAREPKTILGIQPQQVAGKKMGRWKGEGGSRQRPPRVGALEDKWIKNLRQHAERPGSAQDAPTGGSRACARGRHLQPGRECWRRGRAKPPRFTSTSKGTAGTCPRCQVR